MTTASVLALLLSMSGQGAPHGLPDLVAGRPVVPTAGPVQVWGLPQAPGVPRPPRIPKVPRVPRVP